MTVQPLLARCLAHDRKAWADLWEIATSAVLPLVRRMVHGRGRDSSLADDILQEFYLYLQGAEGSHSLQCFRENTEPELQGFLRTLARKFTWRHLRTLRQAEDEERTACACHGPGQETSLSEKQLGFALQELVKMVSRAELGRLGLIFMSESAARERGRPLAEVFPLSEQTLRKWIRELVERYGHRLTIIP